MAYLLLRLPFCSFLSNLSFFLFIHSFGFRYWRFHAAFFELCAILLFPILQTSEYNGEYCWNQKLDKINKSKKLNTQSFAPVTFPSRRCLAVFKHRRWEGGGEFVLIKKFCADNLKKLQVFDFRWLAYRQKKRWITEKASGVKKIISDKTTFLENVSRVLWKPSPSKKQSRPLAFIQLNRSILIYLHRSFHPTQDSREERNFRQQNNSRSLNEICIGKVIFYLSIGVFFLFFSRLTFERNNLFLRVSVFFASNEYATLSSPFAFSFKEQKQKSVQCSSSLPFQIPRLFFCLLDALFLTSTCVIYW